MSDYSGIARRITEDMVMDLEPWIHSGLAKYADYCESPIETMLLASFALGTHIAAWAQRVPIRSAICRQSELPKPNTTTLIVPQFQWNNFRIDFAFFMYGATEPSLFIECDGHDFHERTPEQAERDRSRDRAVQQAGIPILRFTGREIYRSPSACCAQIVQFLARVPKAPTTNEGAA